MGLGLVHVASPSVRRFVSCPVQDPSPPKAERKTLKKKKKPTKKVCCQDVVPKKAGSQKRKRPQGMARSCGHTNKTMVKPTKR